jgi:hypothetical protein
VAILQVGADALIDSTLEAQYRIAVSAFRNGAQNIGAGAFNTVQFNDEVFDVGLNYDSVTNFRFTAPQDRPYWLNALVTITPQAGNFAAGDLCMLTFNLNAGITEVWRYSGVIGTADASPRALPLTKLLRLAGTNYIVVQAFCTTAFAVSSGPALSFFEVTPQR